MACSCVENVEAGSFVRVQIEFLDDSDPCAGNTFCLEEIALLLGEERWETE